MEKAIKIYNLIKIYDKKIVVDNVSLEINKGEIFGLLGKSGAGKSSLINMITGITRPTSGHFEILGQKSKSLKGIRQKIGVLPEYYHFNEDNTAINNLKYYSDLHKLKLPRNKLEEVLHLVGLEDAIKTKVKNFSFGMKKKLGLAQSLVNNPEILFLDEPTSGVDVNSSLEIQNLIGNLASKGTTVILTSHNLNEVEKLCDVICIMDKGKIQAKGNIDELKSTLNKKIKVQIRHGTISKDKQQVIREKLSSLKLTYNIEGYQTSVFVDNDRFIPEINKMFIHNNIDVYSIEQNTSSLEEIFINIGA